MVVSSSFAPEAHAELLGPSLPLQHCQPMHIMQRGEAAASPPSDGASSLLKGQTAGGQLTADRTSLILQGLSSGPLLGEAAANPGLRSEAAYSGQSQV